MIKLRWRDSVDGWVYCFHTLAVQSEMQSAIVVTLALSPGHPVATRSRSLRAVAVDTPAASQKTFTGRPGGDFEVLDVEAMRAASTFPIAPDDLIFRCQEVLAANVGTKDPDMLADDFEFAGPVVGPINKEQYLKAVDRNDEAGWRSVSEYFPPSKSTTNASYYAKASIQMAAMFVSQGRYQEAESSLAALLRHPTLESVYRTIALARRCMILEQLEQGNQLAEVRRELQSVYRELISENPEGRQFVDRVLTQPEKLLLGLVDS